MQRFILSISMFLLCCCSLTAQVKHTPQERQEQQTARLLQRAQPDQLVFKGYIITVQHALAGAYGYDISKEGKVLISQRKNPFNQSPVGLTRKEDAIKVAKWQISQLSAGTPSARLVHSPLPKNLSKELNIRVH